MYPTKAEHEVLQQMVTGYPPSFQNSSAPPQHLQPPTHSYPQQGGLPHSIEWSSGLCACSEDPSNLEIVDEGSSACALSGGLYAALLYFTGCACCYACMYRNKMRAKYNLAESPCTDCLVRCFCDSCALCQEYKELKHRGFDPTLGWRGLGQQQGMGHAMAAPGYATMQK